MQDCTDDLFKQVPFQKTNTIILKDIKYDTVAEPETAQSFASFLFQCFSSLIISPTTEVSQKPAISSVYVLDNNIHIIYISLLFTFSYYLK